MSTPSRRRWTALAFPILAGLMLSTWLLPLSGLWSPHGDSGQMVWNLWHVTEAIQRGETPYETDLVYFPVGANLATHTLAAGFFPVTALVKLASGGSPLYPFYAYKLAVYLCFLLLLVFSHLFLRSLGFTTGEALVPAIAYAFCDYYFFHLSQLNLVCGFLMPLNALLAVRAYRKPTWPQIALSAFALGVTPYFGEYFAYLVLLVSIVGVAMLAPGRSRAVLASRLRAAGPGALAAGLLVFGLTLAHFGVYWWQARPMPIDPLETSRFSANLAGFLVPDPAATPLYRWISGLLPGDPLAALAASVSAGMGGFEVFVGFPVLLLGLAGFRAARGAGLLALCFWLLSLGPSLKVFAVDTGLPLPFSLLQEVPPFDQSRTPVRFSAMAAFLWTIPAAAGVRALSRWAGRGRPATARQGLLALLALWTLAESWPASGPSGEVDLPVEKVRRLGDGPVLCVPVNGNRGYHAALQTLHGQPISSGYLARLDTAQVGLRDRLRAALRHEPHELGLLVASLGYRNVLITEPIPWFVFQRLAALPVNVVSLPEQPYPPESAIVFGGEATGTQAATVPFGRVLRFARGARGPHLLRQGWSVPEVWGTWSDGEEAVLAFELGEMRPLLFRAGARIFGDQELFAELNGTALGNLAGGDEAERLRFRLPQRLLRRNNVLRFRLPGARSPRGLGLGDDARRLGIGLEWMILDEAGEP